MELYTDGGVIGRNPSAIGGTWAWCLVDDGEVIREGSGIITPNDISKSTVSNNDTELYAAVRGLEAVGPNFDGVWFTDSKVTIHRLTSHPKFTGCPLWLRKRAEQLRDARKWTVILLGGHPTKADLKIGKMTDGSPVSEWNVRCDKECCRLAEEDFK